MSTPGVAGGEITPQMERIVDLRKQRLSYRAIANALGLHYTTVYESHQAALKYIKRLPEHIESFKELRLVEESEYIDAQLRRYHEIYDKCMETGKYRNAIEALNGAHKYVETLIKLQALAPPERHKVELTVDDLRAELLRIEAEVGEITSEDIDALKQISAS
jgi:hypothetical protein